MITKCKICIKSPQCNIYKIYKKNSFFNYFKNYKNSKNLSLKYNINKKNFFFFLII